MASCYAGAMYDAMTRHAIQSMRLAGVPQREVTARTGASERTQRRVTAEPPITDAAMTEAARRATLGRPSLLLPFEPSLRSWLEAEPKLLTTALVTRLRDAGCTAGKSAIYAAVARLRPADGPDGVRRFEGVAGEFSQHDFGEVIVRYEDGTRERLHFFASRLKYSRMVRVLLTPDQRTETICHALVDAFAFFGGAPLISVFDNPRTMVTAREGRSVTWQETFACFCTEVGIVPLATWPRRPQEKGAVENLVGFVKRSFFKAWRFRNRADLEEKLAAWHVLVNDERPSRATGEIPRARHLLEQPRLQALKLPREGLTLRHSRVVRCDGFVEHDGRRYFAGMDHVGQVATLFVGRETIALEVGGEKVGPHPRRPVNGRYSVLPTQRRELLEKPGARPYAKRQLLLDLCPAAEWMVTEIRHRRPQRWVEEVDALFDLLDRCGEAALKAAMTEAAARETVGAEYVEAILGGQHAEARAGAGAKELQDDAMAAAEASR